MLGKTFAKLLFHIRGLVLIGRSVNEAKILTAKLLIERLRDRDTIADIREAEFKVFSQFGEDGIIQYLVRKAGITGDERRLVVNNNWSGLLIDGKEKSIATLRKQSFFWERDLTAIVSFITAENINDVIGGAGYQGKIGLLSIDIDGNDYWVWEKLTVVDPVIVVAEYNSVYGPSRAVTVPYDPRFYRMDKHYSGIYYGCSLKALEVLAERKGYALVGCNSDGNNCFFVKRDRLNGQPALTSEEAYVPMRYRESRDRKGDFVYKSSFLRLGELAHLPLVDVQTDALIRVGDLTDGSRD
jgi:hypothetical protein